MGEETDRITELSIHPATELTKQWIVNAGGGCAPEDIASAFRIIYREIVAALSAK